MFSTRFTSFCLLAVYGLLSGLGPSWHRHGCGCHRGSTSPGSTSPGSGNSVQQSSVQASSSHCASRDCAFCTKRNKSQSEVEGSSAYGAKTNPAGDEPCGDDCLVCHFYAQVHHSDIKISPPEISFLLGSVTLPTLSDLFIYSTPCRARGPPLVAFAELS